MSDVIVGMCKLGKFSPPQMRQLTFLAILFGPKRGESGPRADRLYLVVFLIIAALCAVVSLAAEAQRLQRRSDSEWWNPFGSLFTRDKKEDYTSKGWSLVISRRILIAVGVAWVITTFIRNA